MFIDQLELGNWKNFKAAKAPLAQRTFLIGPNASGKSNLLDAFRFIRDVATHGLVSAVSERGGLSSLRSLYARQDNTVRLSFRVRPWEGGSRWTYTLRLKQTSQRQVRVAEERVTDLMTNRVLVERPNREDEQDELLLSQTHLEQIVANREFRELAEYFKSIEYLHIVPQALRDPSGFTGRPVTHDPFGRDLLARMGEVHQNTRNARLSRIGNVLSQAVPQLKGLEYELNGGEPHLVARYEHWRPNAAKQSESQLSDGTLRLFGLLWALLEPGGPLLFEEPELSLHPEIVRHLPGLMNAVLREARDMRRKAGAGQRQLVISTHSPELLSHKSIGAEEVLLLVPSAEGTEVRTPDVQDRQMLSEGLTVADVMLPKSGPQQLHLGFVCEGKPSHRRNAG